MNPLKIGIVGTGSAAKMHYEALANIEEATVSAVCGTDPNRLGSIASLWAVPGFSSVSEMVRTEELDVVLVANKTFRHASDAREAIEAGANVLVEKPLDVSLTSARELLLLAERHSKTIGVVLQKRFDKNILKIRDVLRDHLIGEIVTAKVDVFMHRGDDYFHDKGWITDPQQVGGGVLLHHAIHFIDVMLWLIDARVLAVSGWTSHFFKNRPVEDCGGGWIKFNNGITASIYATVVAYPALRNRIEIVGTSGHLVLEGTELHVTPIVNANESDKEGQHIPMGSVGEIESLWLDYLDALKGGNRLPIVSGQSALRTEMVIRALYESSQSSKTVLIDLQPQPI